MSTSQVSDFHSVADLMFVNISRPQDIKDRQTQKKINSHVMKPIGVTRRRVRPNQKIEMTFRSLETTQQHPDDIHEKSLPILDTSSLGSKAQETSFWAFGSRHSLNLVPSLCPDRKPSGYPMSDRTNKILLFLAVDQEAPVCKLMRELCFVLAFADDSAMHLILARLDIDPEQNGGQAPQENAKTLTHYNSSVEILRNKLEDPRLMAHEAIIGVVVNLACYDVFTDNLTRWKTHMLGLQKMIQYRGGIYTLSSQYLQVTATWMDLLGSMILDQTPYLTQYQADHSIALYVQSNASYELLDAVQKSHGDIEVLLELLLKLSNLATGKSELDLSQDSALLEALQAAVYRTLTLPRYNSPTIQQHFLAPCLIMYEILRLAVLVYLSGPVTFLAGNRVFNVVTPHLRGRLSRMYREQRLDWTGLEHVELFILVVGALTEVGEDRRILIANLHRIMIAQGLRWSNLIDKLRSMAWVDIVWSADLDKLRVDLALMAVEIS
ncbi:hypothetical protein FSARC_4466 [Fusarium sarcochroum]|uniref:Uncharacterized protein n=1 Tax=Fusarium sarcochroum TaxID=1208366 RepID=A0A8H4XBB1_9HYPO|nr:hypothetical protein FSARC_4466 [Fusarium sarcochroum]